MKIRSGANEITDKIFAAVICARSVFIEGQVSPADHFLPRIAFTFKKYLLCVLFKQQHD